MLKWAQAVGKVVILAAGLIVVYRVWVLFAPDPPSTYLRSDLVAAQESDTFITGFATVALMRFDTGDGLEPFSFVETAANRERIEGFCYRLYELAIGYDSLWATVSQAEAAVEDGVEIDIDPPRVLAANAIDSRHSGDTSQYDCDRIDLVNAGRDNRTRLDALQQTLMENGQWDAHVHHARNVVTAFSTRLADWRRKALELRLEALEENQRELQAADTPEAINRWIGSARQDLALDDASGERGIRRTTGILALDNQAMLDPATLQRGDNLLDSIRGALAEAIARESSNVRTNLADAGGYLGTLRLTFAAIGIFTQTGRRFLFLKQNEFYIRQDFADAIYGSDFTLDVAQTGGLFGPRRLEVTVPEPHLLALDRYTSVVVDSTRNTDFEINGDDTGTRIDSEMRADLQLQLDRVEPKAIRFAKALLTSQVQSLVQADVDEISVRFAPADSPTLSGTALLDDLIIRNGQQQTPTP